MHRLILLTLSIAACWATAAQAQIVPQAAAISTATPVAADPYTITGVIIDIPVASAQTARDTALLAAERQALQRLKEQLAATGASTDAIKEPTDAQLARMVQNFEVAGERLSARRYTGTFTIRFRPSAVGGAAAHAATAPEQAVSIATATLNATFRFTSLSQWTAVQQRLRTAGPIQSADITTIGRGYLKMILSYTGTEAALAHALEGQGLQLQPVGPGTYDIIDQQG